MQPSADEADAVAALQASDVADRAMERVRHEAATAQHAIADAATAATEHAEHAAGSAAGTVGEAAKAATYAAVASAGQVSKAIHSAESAAGSAASHAAYAVKDGAASVTDKAADATSGLQHTAESVAAKAAEEVKQAVVQVSAYPYFQTLSATWCAACLLSTTLCCLDIAGGPAIAIFDIVQWSPCCVTCLRLELNAYDLAGTSRFRATARAGSGLRPNTAASGCT